MALQVSQLTVILQHRPNAVVGKVVDSRKSLVECPKNTGVTRHIRCSSKAPRTREEFFQADIVEYGNRYNRPDRFPRLKNLAKSDKPVPVRKWLRDQCATINSAFVLQNDPRVAPDEGDLPEAFVEEATRFSLLLAQGRLEEAAEVTKVALAANNPLFAVNPELVLYGTQKDAHRCVEFV